MQAIHCTVCGDIIRKPAGTCCVFCAYGTIDCHGKPQVTPR